MKRVSFEGIGEVVATMKCKSGVAEGVLVKMAGSGQVGPCAAGDRPCGVALAAEDGLAAVQVAGFAQVRCTGSVAAGWVKLSADGSGGMKADASGGTEYLVAAADAAEGNVVILL